MADVALMAAGDSTVSEATDRVRAEELKLLRAIRDGVLSEYLELNKTDLAHDIARELHEGGVFKSNPFKPVSGRASYPAAKITSRGRARLAELEQIAVPDHAGKPSANGADKQKDRVNNAIRRVGEGVVIFVLGAAALWAIAHWSSVLLGVIG